MVFSISNSSKLFRVGREYAGLMGSGGMDGMGWAGIQDEQGPERE